MIRVNKKTWISSYPSHTHTRNGKLCAAPAELPGPGLGRADLPSVPAAAAALGPEEEDEEAEGRG